MPGWYGMRDGNAAASIEFTCPMQLVPQLIQAQGTQAR